MFVHGLQYEDQMNPDIRLLAYRFRNTTHTFDVISKDSDPNSGKFDQVWRLNLF